MGILRFLLAAAVIVSHSTKLVFCRPLNGNLAVSVFFIISGYYMAMVLDKKYKNQYRLFITNRWFRLAPSYYFVLVLTGILFAVSITLGKPNAEQTCWISAWNNHQWDNLLLQTVVQLTIVGMEIPAVLWYSVTTNLTWSQSGPESVGAWMFLLVPQAWSLSLELMFYSVAPFLVRWKTRWILSLAGLSLLLSVSLRICKVHNTWYLKILPPEFFLFLFGIIAYRYGHIWVRKIPSIAYKLITLLFMVLILFLRAKTDTWKEWAIYAGAVLVIPYLFSLTRSNKWDRWIEEPVDRWRQGRVQNVSHPTAEISEKRVAS